MSDQQAQELTPAERAILAMNDAREAAMAKADVWPIDGPTWEAAWKACLEWAWNDVKGEVRPRDADGRALCFECRRPQSEHPGGIECSPIPVERPDDEAAWPAGYGKMLQAQVQESARALGRDRGRRNESIAQRIRCIIGERNDALAAARLPEQPDEGVTEAMVEAAVAECRRWGLLEESEFRADNDSQSAVLRCALEAALAARPIV